MKEQAWLENLRTKAFHLFKEVGYPTPKQEAWKYNNVTPLTKITFETLKKKEEFQLEKRDIEKFTIPNLKCHRLVFVDGFFSEKLSSVNNFSQKVVVKSLGEALQTEPLKVKPYLNLDLDYKEYIFSALNTAFFKDGVFIHVPKGVVVEDPIHILFISSGSKENSASYIRNLIVTEENSQLTFVESYGGIQDKVGFTNSVTEVIVGERALVDHTLIQEEGLRAFHMGRLEIHQKKESSFSSHSFSLGGSLSRNDIIDLFEEEGARSRLVGLFKPEGSQHMDNHIVVDHQKPRCTSHQVYKGVLDDRSEGVFDGKIFVRQDAQKSDAHQENKNLLLSKDATVYAKPHLEIYADDVKCTHGSSTGQLDESALFYMMSRGIGFEQARGMLVHAFASDVINGVRSSALREYLGQRVFL